MRDGPIRTTVKLASLVVFATALGVSRLAGRVRGQRRWKLGGTCGGCARCCEEPSIRVDRLTWFLPTLRRAFLWWQRVVNGFTLVGEERRLRVFSFRCTHFDRTTRRCDSYFSRPGICRDYPRALLDAAWPELLDGCGFRAVAANGERMLVQLNAQGVPAEKVAELSEKLRLR